MEVKQGEIYWVLAKDLDVQGSEQKKSRPYLIVSRTAINRLGKNVVGVPLTTKMHKANAYRIKIPVQFMVKEPLCTRTLQDSVALTDHIRVLDVDRLEQPKMGAVSLTAVGGIELGLSYLFDIR
ncbi:MAG: type II toxin-antitoxin system PemK/MazF family toxin [Terriglobales bacterium]|jgi:mRNA-degrading endonuclease toxin of MazEF toxin-antitoxin module